MPALRAADVRSRTGLRLLHRYNQNKEISCYWENAGYGKFGPTELLQRARLPIPKLSYYQIDPLLSSANTEVTLYRRFCARCTAVEAWCITLDNRRITLNPDDVRVHEQFEIETDRKAKEAKNAVDKDSKEGVRP